MTDTQPSPTGLATTAQPDRVIAVRDVFGIESDLAVPAFGERDEHVPEVDPAYRFNPDKPVDMAASLPQILVANAQFPSNSGTSEATLGCVVNTELARWANLANDANIHSE